LITKAESEKPVLNRVGKILKKNNMLYDNSISTFFTGGDNGTSMYFVRKNGTIRAKIANNTLRVRPYKNMMFVSYDDGQIILDNNILRVEKITHNELRIHLDNQIIQASRVHTNPLNTPVDMHLDRDGTYNGGRHVGHEIVPNFDSGATGITEENCIQAANQYINQVTNRINVEDDINVPII
jgi:hypothetical protein